MILKKTSNICFLLVILIIILQIIFHIISNYSFIDAELFGKLYVFTIVILCSISFIFGVINIINKQFDKKILFCLLISLLSILYVVFRMIAFNHYISNEKGLNYYFIDIDPINETIREDFIVYLDADIGIEKEKQLINEILNNKGEIRDILIQNLKSTDTGFTFESYKIKCIDDINKIIYSGEIKSIRINRFKNTMNSSKK